MCIKSGYCWSLRWFVGQIGRIRGKCSISFSFSISVFFFIFVFSSFATSRFVTVSFADFSETNHLLCSANGATQSARIEKRIENYSHRGALAFFVHEIFPTVISNVGSSISMQWLIVKYYFCVMSLSPIVQVQGCDLYVVVVAAVVVVY